MNAKILIAEGDTPTRLGLVSHLEGEGYSVTAAGDHEQTLRLFDQQKFDLLLLCVRFSNANGGDLRRALRAKNSNVPILFLTTAGEDEPGRGERLELGAHDDYVAKPFVASELFARMEALLFRAAG